MKLVGRFLKLVGDVCYRLNDRGSKKEPRTVLLQWVTDVCYRNARSLGVKVEW